MGRGIAKTMMTGLKAIAGALMHYVAMALIILIVGFIVGGFINIGPGLIALLAVLLLLTGIFILGWVYNALWGWK